MNGPSERVEVRISVLFNRSFFIFSLALGASLSGCGSENSGLPNPAFIAHHPAAPSAESAKPVPAKGIWFYGGTQSVTAPTEFDITTDSQFLPNPRLGAAQDLSTTRVFAPNTLPYIVTEVLTYSSDGSTGMVHVTITDKEKRVLYDETSDGTRNLAYSSPDRGELVYTLNFHAK
jgi:hypothetical protein